MRIFAFLTLSFLFLTSFAHRGEFLAINNVEIVETEVAYIYHFEVENINKVEVRDVKIEFVLNGKSILQKSYAIIKAGIASFNEKFYLPKEMINPDKDMVQIEITQIFGKKEDWGGWDSPNVLKQSNTPAGDYNNDAPWRMKKTDGSGNLNDIPVLMFMHDADEAIAPQLDYINVRIKNASDASFGAVLTYNSVPTTDFHNMLSCGSVADAQMDIRGFSTGDFVASANYTFDFNIETDFFGGDYLTISEDFWYFTFNIPASELVGMEDVIDIEVLWVFDNLVGFSDEINRFRVFRSDVDIPTQADYYRGDTHLHSMYTQNDAEAGSPLCATKEAAKLIGLDWITTTDHTSDFDNYGDGNINNNWAVIQSEAAALNATDPSMIYIPGQEVAANNNDGKLVHMLAYPSYSAPLSLPFLGDGNGDLSGTSVSVDDALTQLHSVNGFAFAAHPFATEDKLPLVPVNGGIWNLGDPGFAVNGETFLETGGNLICNDPTLTSDVLSTEPGKLVKDALKGSQIWNHRANIEVGGLLNGGGTDSHTDPWDLANDGDAFSQKDTASFGYHFKKFRQGQEVVNYINQLGLQLKNGDSTYSNWKMYFSAGADAHGSFNYSNTGDVADAGTIDDNAVGKLNTLAYCPNGMGANGENILKAMHDGHISLSDGPILTMGISSDGNNTSNEILMGDDSKVQIRNIEDYYLNFHYTTTAEFGNVTKFTFVVGTETGEIRKDMSLSSLSGDNNVSYLLSDILDSIIGFSGMELEQFYYIRAELQTYKDYSALSQIYKRNYEYFHSFTNPIWLKLTEELDIEVTDFELESYPNPFDGNFTLIIKNPGKEDIMLGIYNDIGQLIYSEEVYVDNYKELNLNATELGMSNGMYTIRAVIRDKSKELKVIKY